MFGIVRHARSILRQTYFNSARLLGLREYSHVDEDGDVSGMKTTVSFMNDEMEGLGINAFSQVGFVLNNGLRVVGPCAIFPRSILQWNVQDVEDINEESLSLFTMLEPKLDILLLGVGNYEEIRKLDRSVIKHLYSHKISVEVLGTEQAVSTFNFLCEEKRYVAAALIPPSRLEMDNDEIFVPEGERTPEADMLRVLQRMARLRGEEEIKQLPGEDDR